MAKSEKGCYGSEEKVSTEELRDSYIFGSH